VTLTTEAPAVEPAERLPWEYDPAAPTVHTNTHILVGAPSITFDGRVYPNIDIHDSEGFFHASFRLTLTGNAEQRRVAAAALRATADAIETWTEEPTGV